MSDIEEPKWCNNQSYAEMESNACNSPTSSPINNQPKIEIIKEEPSTVETVLKENKDKFVLARRYVIKAFMSVLCVGLGIFLALYLLIHILFC